MSKRYWIGLLAVTTVVASGMSASDAREKLRDRLRERVRWPTDQTGLDTAYASEWPNAWVPTKVQRFRAAQR